MNNEEGGNHENMEGDDYGQEHYEDAAPDDNDPNLPKPGENGEGGEEGDVD